MNIENIEKASSMKNRRDGLLFLLKFEDYQDVGLVRGANSHVEQPIGRWFSDIKESIKEMADSELRALELDMKNMGIEFEPTPAR